MWTVERLRSRGLAFGATICGLRNQALPLLPESTGSVPARSKRERLARSGARLGSASGARNSMPRKARSLRSRPKEQRAPLSSGEPRKSGRGETSFERSGRRVNSPSDSSTTNERRSTLQSSRLGTQRRPGRAARSRQPGPSRFRSRHPINGSSPHWPLLPRRNALFTRS